MTIGYTNPMQYGGNFNKDILMAALMMSQMNQGMGTMPSFGTQMPYGMDGLQLSDNYYDQSMGRGMMPSFGSPYAGQRMGYNGGFSGIPGFGGFGGMQGMGGQQQIMQQMMQMMMMMMMMMQQMGMGQQQPYGQNPYGQQPFGQNPMNPYGQQQNPYGQQGGQTIELQKGQTFTTPGGCTIHWDGGKDGKKSEVNVHEPGGGARDLADGFASASASVDKYGNATAAAAAWGNGAAASAAAAGLYGSASASAVSGQAKYANQARDWKVWGDPHIKNADGSKQDFKTKNAMFTLQDGTKVLMCADKPDGNVNKVRITLPGGQMNMQGVDQKQTTVYANDGQKFNSMGTLDQYMNQFPNAGLNQSPFGNTMCPGPG